MEEDCADARRGPLGGQPPRSVSARNVCGVTSAPAVRRSAEYCPSSLDLWLRCTCAHWLVALSTPRHLPRDSCRVGVARPHLRGPCELCVSTDVSAAPGLPRAAAPGPSGADRQGPRRLDHRSGWPGSRRRRASTLVHSRAHQWLDLAKRLALAAGSHHVRSLPAAPHAAGVADSGGAQRQANRLDAGGGPRVAREWLSSFVRPLISTTG